MQFPACSNQFAACFTIKYTVRACKDSAGFEHSELYALHSLDVVRLRLDYKESKRADEFGNQFRYRARVEDARGARVDRWAWDVFLTGAP